MKLSLVSYLDITSSTIVRELQQELSEITGSRASLSSWEPHITVGDGVEIDSGVLKELPNQFESLAVQTNPFKLDLRGINTLVNWQGGDDEVVTPFVIYVNVAVNQPLSELVGKVSNISGMFKKWYFMPKPYSPHCTLAFRDLDDGGFKLGIEYLEKKNITLSATIDHIALVEKLPNFNREFMRFNFEG